MIFAAKARQLCTAEQTQLCSAFHVTSTCTVQMHCHNATLALCYVMAATCALLGFGAQPVKIVFVKLVTIIRTVLP